MNYQQAWEFLDKLQFFKIKLGLDSMNRFLESLGHPQRRLRFVHVAGTNGKGSVSATLLTLLARAGYRVGLYTSPHLSSVRERFRINDSYISREEFARFATQIHDILDNRRITYFEFTTALALLWFASQEVDVAILEVGMGGRLDATNVIRPLAGIITNVSMDHEAYLGDTLEEVAYEKAGIIKPGVPVVSGVDDPVSRRVVEETCGKRGAPLYLLDRDFYMDHATDASWTYRGLSGAAPVAGLVSPLIGEHQAGNTALALAALELLAGEGFCLDGNAVRAGLATVRWPGRLEYCCLQHTAGPSLKESLKGKTIPCKAADEARSGRSSGDAATIEAEDNADLRQYLLDGAHNPAGVRSLQKTLESSFRYDRLFLVWGSMADKDNPRTLSTIAPLSDHIIFTRPAGERSAAPESLKAQLPGSGGAQTSCVPVVAEALDRARTLATPRDLICVAGSLYLIGEARRLLLGDLVT